MGAQEGLLMGPRLMSRISDLGELQKQSDPSKMKPRGDEGAEGARSRSPMAKCKRRSWEGCAEGGCWGRPAPTSQQRPEG